MNIVIIGFMATGKTIVGRKLAKKINMEFIDTDKLIEQKEKMSINKIFSEKGEDCFRELEKNLIKKISRKNNVVISTGGGVVLFSENMTRLRRNGIVICLKTRPEIILRRVEFQKGIRPLLNKSNPLKEIRDILKKREVYYKQADIFIDTTDFNVNKIVKKILKEISALTPAIS